MPVGETKDVGWEIGVSKTLRHPVEAVWQVLVGQPSVWLGPGAELPAEKGDAWRAGDGSGGELRSRREHDRLRLTHWSPSAGHESTVQVALRAASSGTRVTFHQERLRNADEREAQRSHWQGVMAQLEKALASA